MEKTIIYVKNEQGEIVAFQLERVGRYNSIEHLKECHPEAKIIPPEDLPKVITY